MRDRLYLAKKLLSHEGIIFISIDDSEQAYLKVLMDDIFGEENFVNQLVWVSNKKGRQISGKMFAKTYEYILVYAKDISTINKFEILKDEAQKLMPKIYEKRNEEILKDEYSEFIIQNELHNTNIKEFNEITRKNLRFPIYTNGKDFSVVKKDEWKEIWPPKNKDGIGAVWRWQKSKVESESFNLYAEPNKSSYKIFTKKRDFVYTAKDIIISSSMTTKSGSSQLESIGMGNSFQFPKPTSLIKFLISSFKKDATILDFFAGSGTTGQAVMELNKEDQGCRNFILCTNNENNIALEVTYERLFRLINGKGTKEETFDWIEKNEPFNNENLRVFALNHYDVSIASKEKIDNLKEIAFRNLKLLSNNYKNKEIDIFYDLSGLNPYNNFQKSEILNEVKKWL